MLEVLIIYSRRSCHQHTFLKHQNGSRCNHNYSFDIWSIIMLYMIYLLNYIRECNFFFFIWNCDCLWRENIRSVKCPKVFGFFVHVFFTWLSCIWFPVKVFFFLFSSRNEQCWCSILSFKKKWKCGRKKKAKQGT